MKLMTYSKLALIAIGALMMGCASPEEIVCEAAAACAGQGEVQEEICLVQAEANQEIAELRACAEVLDEYYECLEEGTVCTNGRLEVADQCKELQSRTDGNSDCFKDIVTIP